MPERPTDQPILTAKLPTPAGMVNFVDTLITRRNHPASTEVMPMMPRLRFLKHTESNVAIYGPVLLGGGLIVAKATEFNAPVIHVANTSGNTLETSGRRIIEAYQRFGDIDPTDPEFPDLSVERLDHHLSELDLSAIGRLYTGLCDLGLTAQHIAAVGLTACLWYNTVQPEANTA